MLSRSAGLLGTEPSPEVSPRPTVMPWGASAPSELLSGEHHPAARLGEVLSEPASFGCKAFGVLLEGQRGGTGEVQLQVGPRDLPQREEPKQSHWWRRSCWTRHMPIVAPLGKGCWGSPRAGQPQPGPPQALPLVPVATVSLTGTLSVNPGSSRPCRYEAGAGLGFPCWPRESQRSSARQPGVSAVLQPAAKTM